MALWKSILLGTKICDEGNGTKERVSMKEHIEAKTKIGGEEAKGVDAPEKGL